MKKTLLILPLLILFSCSVQKRKYQNGYYVSWHNKHLKKDNSQDKSVLTANANKENVNADRAIITDGGKKIKQGEPDLLVLPKIKIKKIVNYINLPDDTCDVLVYKDGAEIRGKIMEVGIEEIKYKRCDTPDGPLYISKKSEVFMIKYANGSREVIKSDLPPQKVQAPAQKAGNANYGQNKYRRENHPLAIASLMFGSLAVALIYFVGFLVAFGSPAILLLLPFLAGLIAVASGKAALNNIRQQPDLFKGAGPARTGLIMGLVITGIYLMVLFIAALSLGFI